MTGGQLARGWVEGKLSKVHSLFSPLTAFTLGFFSPEHSGFSCAAAAGRQLGAGSPLWNGLGGFLGDSITEDGCGFQTGFGLFLLPLSQGSWRPPRGR